MEREEIGKLLHLYEGRQLTDYQREHWEQQLECAERAVETALRMLGRLPIERGLAEDEPC